MSQESIESSFKATGIHPFNPSIILERFKKTRINPAPASGKAAHTDKQYNTSDHVQIRLDLTSLPSRNVAKKLERTFHHLSVRNTILNIENQGLRQAISTKKHHKKRAIQLPPELQATSNDGAVLWTAEMIDAERQRHKALEDIKLAEKAQKLQDKKDRDEKKVEKERELQEKREAAAEKKKQTTIDNRAKREAIDARKKARKEARQHCDNQQGNTTACRRQPQPKKPENKTKAKARARVEPRTPPPAPPGATTRRGRDIRKPQRYNYYRLYSNTSTLQPQNCENLHPILVELHVFWML
jgi:hypothetical protein